MPDPTEGAYSCASWDPDALITGPIGDDYGIYLNLITSLRNDPTPLFECDSARVNVTSGLVIQDAVSTDMAYLLGLRNGDLLVEVNGMSLADPLDAYVAYNQLWELDGETEYTLKIERNSQYVYLTYGVLAVQP